MCCGWPYSPFVIVGDNHVRVQVFQHLLNRGAEIFRRGVDRFGDAIRGIRVNVGQIDHLARPDNCSGVAAFLLAHTAQLGALAHRRFASRAALAAGGHQNIYIMPFFGIFDQGTAGAGFVVRVSSNGQNDHGNLVIEKI